MIKRLALYLAPVLLLAVLGFYGLPYLLALYHQVEGGKLLSQVLASHPSANQGEIVCTLDPLVDPPVLDQLDRALDHLEKALEYHPGLAHAALLAGRAHCLAGDYENAVAAYEIYTRLRPNNPLGYLEMGFAYEAGCRDELENEEIFIVCEKKEDQSKIIGAWKVAQLMPQDLLGLSRELAESRQYKKAWLFYEWVITIVGFRMDELDSNDIYHPILILDSFLTTDRWSPCPWCGNAPGYFGSKDGILEMSYQNRVGKRDAFGFLTYPNIVIEDYSHLIFRVKGKAETLLTIEVMIDGQRNRVVNYQEVGRDWEFLQIPLTGYFLDEILVGIGELADNNRNEEYQLFLDWIILR